MATETTWAWEIREMQAGTYPFKVFRKHKLWPFWIFEGSYMTRSEAIKKGIEGFLDKAVKADTIKKYYRIEIVLSDETTSS